MLLLSLKYVEDTLVIVMKDAKKLDSTRHAQTRSIRLPQVRGLRRRYLETIKDSR